MSLKIQSASFVLISIVIVFFFSCQKVENVQTELTGTWERVVFNHSGAEQWTFTADGKLFITLSDTVNNMIFDGDTVNEGSYTMEIIRYTHGTFLNKDIFRVPAITISGLTNYKLPNNTNIYFPSINTVWQIHQLDEQVLIITTDMEDGVHSGLVIKEFYKKQ